MEKDFKNVSLVNWKRFLRLEWEENLPVEWREIYL